jgi:hypothetical protein
MQLTIDGVADCLRYLCLCVLSVACGVGLLQLGRVSLSRRMMLLLAPTVTHALWALTLGVGVIGGLPVRRFAGGIWLLTGALALYGFRALIAIRGPNEQKTVPYDATALLGLSALAPLVLLLPDTLFGLSSYGGYGSDGWSYVAFSRYIWDFPKGTEGGLAPLYQWASHLSGNRHVGAGELGLLSMLYRGGDVQAAEGTFVALILFTFCSACAAFAASYGLTFAQTLLYVGVTGLSGWMLSVVQVDNYDFGLALAYFPALAAIVREAQLTDYQRGWLIASLGAGLFYAYPELAPVIFACIGLLMFERLRKTPARAFSPMLWALVVFIALTSPYLKESTQYVTNQTTFALRGAARPGEAYFPGLLVPSQQVSAFWSLGGEFLASGWYRIRLAVGLALTILALAGVLRLARGREWGLVIVNLLLFLGTVVFIVRHGYAYGAYKFLVLNWWLLIFAVVVGAIGVQAAARSRTTRWMVGTLALMPVFLIPMTTGVRLERHRLFLTQHAVDHFRPAGQVRWITGGKPVGVLVHDPFAAYWAVYFLRDAPVRLLTLPGYLGMPHVRPLIARSSSAPFESIRFLLTDAVDPGPLIEDEGWRLMWRSGPYALWDTQQHGWAVASEVSTPNGFEIYDGQPFFWMGGGPTGVEITANREGTVKLSARFIPGPNLPPGAAALRLRVVPSSGTARAHAIVAGEDAVCLPVTAGTMTWSLTPVDAPVARSPTGDPRSLLMGVLAPRLRWSMLDGARFDGC